MGEAVYVPEQDEAILCILSCSTALSDSVVVLGNSVAKGSLVSAVQLERYDYGKRVPPCVRMESSPCRTTVRGLCYHRQRSVESLCCCICPRSAL